MTCQQPPPAARCARPVLVADVLDTLVTDPFFTSMSSHFAFPSFASFLSAKTPGVWQSFETGHLPESELSARFFRDGRPVDVPRLKRFLSAEYALTPGIASLLDALRNADVDVHLCTNYPVWADLIEDKLQLTARFGVHWTFISGREGVRKPDVEAFLRTAKNANVRPEHCVLLDDRLQNCQGAIDAGFLHAIRFENAQQAAKQIQHIFAEHNITIHLDPHLLQTDSQP